MAVTGYDFGGWATRNDLLCADGRTIRKNAFAAQNGTKVPLVWNHQHNSVGNVLGHAILENRDEGVYAYCFLNDTESGRQAREDVVHGDVESLSIFANNLKQSRNGDVFHGTIKELSLVLAGANPGAYIDTVIAHGEDSEEFSGIEACYNENITVYMAHNDDEEDEVDEYEEESEEDDDEYEDTEDEDIEDDEEDDDEEDEELEHSDTEDGVLDIINTMTDKQKAVLFGLVGMAAKENEMEEDEMKHNVFEGDNNVVTGNDLMHSDFAEILAEGKRFGSLKEGYKNYAENYLQHDDEGPTYGIADVETLFPEAKELNNPPSFIGRDMDWVAGVISGVHHIPFSRVKTSFADITEDQARARGYIKGSLKKEEVFTLLRRKTEPTTVYKKQKMDRDDILDITDFDVLSWLKVEMRMMLNEEIARAILVGDGRLADDEDHIDETRIRPIMNDADLFVIRYSVKSADDDGVTRAKNFIKASIKSRKNYKGSGNPTLYTTEDMLTDMLLLEDQIGHKLYKTEAELATALRVKNIVTVPVMENVEDKDEKAVLGIIVNLNDYYCGADKGGAINFFEDFDIDYNQQKYLLETRCSGALVKPFSAIVIREAAVGQTQQVKSDEPTMQDAMAPFRKSAENPI